MSNAELKPRLSLTNRRSLVEDEAMITEDIVFELEGLGATVIGPCLTISKAFETINE